MTAHTTLILPEVLISKGAGFSKSAVCVTRTIVCEETCPQAPKTGEKHRRHNGARDRRAEHGKQARRQQRKEHFTDAAAFAYFKGWPLEMRITINWGACMYGDQNEGHILGMPDPARNERLRNELARLLRNKDQAFACIWARDEGPKLGLHIHLGLYWPLTERELVQILARLTGSPPSLDRMPRGVVAQSECHGWQVKRNTARDELRSAMSWTAYLRDQGERHLIPKILITGKVLGVSRSLGLSAVEAQKPALEAWKDRLGWAELEKAERS